MNITTKPIEYFDGKQKCIGYLAWDENVESHRPCVLIGHAWGGRDSNAENKAIQMAAMGYVGFALDVYGDHKLPSSDDDRMATMMPLVNDRKTLLARLEAGMKTAAALDEVDADNMAMIGYCFGGLCALDLARSGADLKAVISFHGLLGAPDLPAKNIKPKVLVAHGWDDGMVPPEDVLKIQKELASKKCDYQVLAFGNTDHAFTVEGGPLYNSDSDRRSWQAATALLDEVFGLHGANIA